MFCTSESSTAICRTTTTDHSTIHLGGTAESARAIDRHNPIIHPSRRSLSSSSSSSQHQNLKAKATDFVVTESRKSSASLVDAVRKSSCIKPSSYFSSPTSKPHLPLTKSQSSTLETDKKAIDAKANRERLAKCSSLKLKNDTPLFTITPSSDKYYYSPFRVNSHQVVVVRVSLHCKGCAGKVKKYISRMQGVTSFNVDFDAKKVIVVGDVTPLEVLATISKVRTAQLLPPEKPTATLDAKQVIGGPIKT